MKWLDSRLSLSLPKFPLFELIPCHARLALVSTSNCARKEQAWISMFEAWVPWFGYDWSVLRSNLQRSIRNVSYWCRWRRRMRGLTKNRWKSKACLLNPIMYDDCVCLSLHWISKHSGDEKLKQATEKSKNSQQIRPWHSSNVPTLDDVSALMNEGSMIPQQNIVINLHQAGCGHDFECHPLRLKDWILGEPSS